MLNGHRARHLAAPLRALPQLNQAAAGAQPMSSSLKPVPSLHKKLVFDKLLSRVSKTCFVG
jgi:hypothetical protein